MYFFGFANLLQINRVYSCDVSLIIGFIRENKVIIPRKFCYRNRKENKDILALNTLLLFLIINYSLMLVKIYKYS